MTRDDIIRMARGAGATPYTNRHYPDRPTHTFNPEQLERFAALVAAHEREECAKVAEDDDYTVDQVPGYYAQLGDARATAQNIAAAIRARGQT